MAAQKTISPNGGVQYVVLDAFNNPLSLDTANPTKALTGSYPGNVQPNTPTISFGFGPENLVVLTQQNVIDLLTALTGFANTGLLS